MVLISRARTQRLLRAIKSRVNRSNQIYQYSAKEDRLIPYYWYVTSHFLSPFYYLILLLAEGLATRSTLHNGALESSPMNSTPSNSCMTTSFRSVSALERRRSSCLNLNFAMSLLRDAKQVLASTWVRIISFSGTRIDRFFSVPIERLFSRPGLLVSTYPRRRSESFCHLLRPDTGLNPNA